MKPLRVALIHFDNPRQYNRAVGFWSYDVPEFEVTNFGVQRQSALRRSQFAREYDVIIREDHKNYGTIANDAKIPYCYYVVDTPASEEKYKQRCRIAPECDLILVEQDRLERFAHLGPQVRRFGYCVNENFFKDYGLEKDIDVGMYYRPISKDRVKLDRWLAGFCKDRGYVYDSGKRRGVDYPRSFNRARISINLGFNEHCRPHRVLDVMACRSCLVTNPLPEVSGEVREAGRHYFEFEDYDHLGRIIDKLLESGLWQAVANEAYELVMAQHTWRIRAGELRQTLAEVFGV